jgi:hypothetical protein
MKNPLPIAHITINTARAAPDASDTRHYCADCRRMWKCPNPEGRIDARVLNNCTFFEGKA